MSSPARLSASSLCCTRGGSLGAVEECSLVLPGAGICLLFGAEGSGHRLLLRLLGLSEAPESGEVFLNGEPTRGWSEAERAAARSRHFGYLFESPFLLPAFNVVENIAMPYFKLCNATPETAQEPTREALHFVGLEEWAEERVSALSPVVQHRVALARALVTRPEIIVIENIDAIMQDAALIDLMELLAAARDRYGVLILISTQTNALAGFADRVLELENGRIINDRTPKRFFP